MRNGHKLSNDLDMLEMIQQNDEHAFNLLYKKYWDPLLNFAAHYLDDKNSCEEIVQELFIQLHIRRFPLNIRSSVASYLFVALRNKILNHLRDEAVYKKHVLIASRTSALTQNNVEQFINARELEGEITFFLDRMPAKWREVYLLRDQSRLTIKKISEVLQRPVDTVEKQLRKATELLRSKLKEYKMNA